MKSSVMSEQRCYMETEILLIKIALEVDPLETPVHCLKHITVGRERREKKFRNTTSFILVGLLRMNL